MSCSNEHKTVWGASKRTFKRLAINLVKKETLPKLNTEQNNVCLETVVASSSTASRSPQAIIISSFVNDLPNSSSETPTIVDNKNTQAEANRICKPNFKEKLSSWAVNFNISGAALNKLLNILVEEGHDFPKDCRTLLHTPTHSTIITIGGGKYYHFGMAKSVSNLLINACNPPAELLIDINIDGVPLSKSSSVTFWVILGRVFNISESPIFVIGIYYGRDQSCKPQDTNAFLREFVDEQLLINQNGILINEKSTKVLIRSFILDAPAKAMVKGTKGHCAFFGCSNCTTEGEHINNRVCYPQLNATLRTDSSFRSQLQEEHHNWLSILQELPIDMIRHFPHDYLHLICLGVVKKMVLAWVNGPMSVRLNKHCRDIISQNLLKMEVYRPMNSIALSVE